MTIPSNEKALEALAAWLEAWKEKDWEGMAEHSWKAFCAKHESPAAALKAMFGGTPRFNLVNFDVTCELVMGRSVNRDVLTKVEWRGTFDTGAADPVVLVFGAILIKEVKPRVPDAVKGTWGVNPTAAMEKGPFLQAARFATRQPGAESGGEMDGADQDRKRAAGELVVKPEEIDLEED